MEGGDDLDYLNFHNNSYRTLILNGTKSGKEPKFNWERSVITKLSDGLKTCMHE